MLCEPRAMRLTHSNDVANAMWWYQQNMILYRSTEARGAI